MKGAGDSPSDYIFGEISFAAEGKGGKRGNCQKKRGKKKKKCEAKRGRLPGVKKGQRRKNFTERGKRANL